MQGLPWKYTWKELKPLFEDCGPIARADVMFGRDGRSRVITGVGELWVSVPTGCKLQAGVLACLHTWAQAARVAPSLVW